MSCELMDAVQVGKRMKDLREGRNMSQAALAEAVGISISAVAMYEAGNRIPRDEVKIRIADYYRVPVESIFFPKKSHETCDK